MAEIPTSSREPLRLILAGVGFWGKSWIPVVRSSPHWELVALVDADESALTQAAGAAELGSSSCFTTISETAQEIESDAVLVVVPPALHAPLAIEALDRGLNCLIEKPFADTIEDARRIVERAHGAERVVMVSQQYRHRPGARTVARLIEEGVVGPVGAAYVRFSHELAVRGFQHELDEPLLRDVAIHHFDLMRCVLRIEPVRVHAVSSNPSWSPFAGNASATVVLDAEDGVAISYAGTLVPRGSGTGWDGIWDIHGENGTIRWDADDVVVKPLARPLFAKIQRRLLKREWNGRRIKPVSVREPDRLGSLAEFASAIREEREPESSGQDNLRSLTLSLAAVESARRQAAVEIAELPPWSGGHELGPSGAFGT